MYVYIQSEPRLFTVGFYDPQGTWNPESDHSDSEAAAKRVAWLNGSVSIDDLEIRLNTSECYRPDVTEHCFELWLGDKKISQSERFGIDHHHD